MFVYLRIEAGVLLFAVGLHLSGMSEMIPTVDNGWFIIHK